MSLSQPLIGVDHQSCLFINPLVDGTSIPPTSYHFVIITSGSRGDVQPYIALGLLLRSKGNDVTIATEKRMEDIVKEFGLDYFPLEGDPTGLLFEQSAKKALQEGSMMKLIKLTEEWDKKFSKVDIFNSIYRACFGDIDHGTRRRADAIIASPLTMTPSYCVAEKLNIPWIPVILGPTMPTNEFPIWPLEKMIPCSCLNRWSYNLAFKMLWNSESKVINPWRQNLDLEPWTDTPRGIADILDRVRPPILIASSKLLCGPRGEVPTDYPINCHVVGFYYVPSSNPGDINADILSFFSHHSESIPGKIVYLGFGSMPSDNPVNLVKLALEITTTCNCRAVLVAGWSELNSTECIHIMQPAIEEKKLLVLKSIPHDWVLPRVDCIVHHCGVSIAYLISSPLLMMVLYRSEQWLQLYVLESLKSLVQLCWINRTTLILSSD